MLRKTKIVCTIGPATAELSTITRLIETGMNVARLNFSHGSHSLHVQYIDNIREAERQTGIPIAIMGDLQGPKIRVGKMEGGKVPLGEDSLLRIVQHEVLGNSNVISTSYSNLVHDVRVGDQLLLDDGYLNLKVEQVENDEITARVVKGGMLKDHKGIIVPGREISLPAMSAKDKVDLEFGLKHGVDYIALSFVQSEKDIIQLRDTMKEMGRVVPIIAKIERFGAFEDIEDIIHESDAIMVARGDLGVEMEVEDVPILQKKIIERSNVHGKPVITATQMLESMIENPRPTRAEASDVANAVFDGTDAVMLSAETSVGKYPFEAVNYMHRILRKAEEQREKKHREYEIPKDKHENISDAIGRACCVIAEQIHASAIIPLTTTGGTAKTVAKYRPLTPIIAMTDREETYRQLSLVWGISAHLIPTLTDTDSTLDCVRTTLLSSGAIREKDFVVYTAGIPLQLRTSTNMLKIEQL